MTADLHFVNDLGFKSKDALEQGDVRRVAALMSIHWQPKKRAAAA